jgi:hypothetical protein
METADSGEAAHSFGTDPLLNAMRTSTISPEVALPWMFGCQLVLSKSRSQLATFIAAADSK